MIFAPVLSTVAKLFWSAEYFALMVLGLTAIAAFAGQGKIIKAMCMTVFGVMLATVGESALHNAARFTMGIMDLQSGIYFVTLVMGLFALPEAIFLILDKKRSQAMANNNKIENLRITKEEAREIAPVIGRQSLLGFFVGVLPGAGATMASF
jgi:putative tricarboxylic transport membrane protein